MNEAGSIIIAGPNGAGKSTLAQELLPGEAGFPTFVNADLFAAGLSPFARELAALRAGRIMLHEIQRHVRSNESFAFETTLSGKRYACMILEWQRAGFTVELIVLRLPDAEMAVARVAARVAHGGHRVAEEVIRRRFTQCWANFQALYRSLVDSRQPYDTSGEHAVLVDHGAKA